MSNSFYRNNERFTARLKCRKTPIRAHSAAWLSKNECANIMAAYSMAFLKIQGNKRFSDASNAYESIA